jgi:alkanesulfonate monooxygenase SsuD/methylene tetrahydromethanopterin reductase-like flavin-dependent oxidoreductase (luciferase family)
MRFMLRYNMRSPGPEPPGVLYRTAIEQCSWADRHGFAGVMLSEHHGRPDGYLPSPAVLGAALGAVSSSMRIVLGALVLPLADVLRAAEDIAVADLASGGRVDVILGAGYNPRDFMLLGRPMADRYRRLEEGVATLRQAWTGAEFSVAGHPARVTPRPAQQPGPPLLIGGSTRRAARRAARLGDGFAPGSDSPELVTAYHEECAAAGATPGPVLVRSGPRFLHVSRDPEADRAAIAAAALFDEDGNSELFRESGRPAGAASWAQLEAQGSHRVLTPDDCVALLSRLDPDACVCLHPLLGAMSPELSWASLELFSSEVMPKLSG